MADEPASTADANNVIIFGEKTMTKVVITILLMVDLPTY